MHHTSTYTYCRASFYISPLMDVASLVPGHCIAAALCTPSLPPSLSLSRAHTHTHTHTLTHASGVHRTRLRDWSIRRRSGAAGCSPLLQWKGWRNIIIDFPPHLK